MLSIIDQFSARSRKSTVKWLAAPKWATSDLCQRQWRDFITIWFVGKKEGNTRIPVLVGEEDGTSGRRLGIAHLEERVQTGVVRDAFEDLGVLVAADAAGEHDHIRAIQYPLLTKANAFISTILYSTERHLSQNEAFRRHLRQQFASCSGLSRPMCRWASGRTRLWVRRNYSFFIWFKQNS